MYVSIYYNVVKFEIIAFFYEKYLNKFFTVKHPQKKK